MSNFCQNCERLQCKPVGTAAERPQFQQATKYDHYENFQKFKQLKEEESQLKKQKEKLLQFGLNCAKVHTIRHQTEEEFEQLNAQDKAKFRHQSQFENRCKIEATASNDIEGPENDKSLQKQTSLLVLTRTPIQCPISTCRRTIGGTLVLSHYLRDHNQEFGVPCEEIYAGKQSVLKFDATVLTYGENFCLGILAYGGEANDRSSRPSERGICINNAFLPKSYEHLATHLPILIMACQTSWTTLLGNTEREVKLHNPNFLNHELLVLWLASPQTVKPIHCIVTVYDKFMKSSRSSIMRIRDLNDEHAPPNFMLKETNFMRLSHGDINELSLQRTEDIHMEIMIKEYL